MPRILELYYFIQLVSLSCLKEKKIWRHRGVANKADRHLQALRRNVAHTALHVVRDPLDEVGAVLVLHVEHLLINLLRRHAATEQTGGGQVTAVTGIRSAHHVLRIEHLLRELRHGQSAVLLGAARRQRREALHEEVQAGERDHVHRELPEVTWLTPKLQILMKIYYFVSLMFS